MNKEVENIQKNMQTVFEGYVNGQKFTNRDAMNQYIGKCISEGTPITDISYSSTTRYNGSNTQRPARASRGLEAIHKAQKEVSWVTYINGINQEVPDPYTSVIGYVVPFVREDININYSNANYIIEDFKARLTNRMNFLETKVFTPIRTWKYDESQVSEWLNLLSGAFQHKLEWANQRTELITEFLEDGDKFIISHIDTSALRGFRAIYSETAGFCTALLDIIKDLQKMVQCGCDGCRDK